MKPVSPPTEDLLGRLREHYRAQGKASAAANYYRHLRAFFSWAEAKGWSVANLPADSVETFLAESGMKETTAHVMRTQIRSAMREAHTAFGAPFGHIEYQTGKPAAVRQAQKAREKERRAEARQEQGATVTDFQTPIEAEDDNQPQETPAATPAAPSPRKAAGGGAAGQPTIIVNVPAQKQAPAAPQKPLSTVGAPPQQPQPRGVVLNNHTFSGAYVKISRIADGSDPLSAPGTEVYITTLPASQLAAHGDIAAYLQTYIVPNLRLAPMTGGVHFVFHELNDRRQPTGRRDELAVSVPMAVGAPGQTPPGLAGFPAYGGQVAAPPEQKGPSFDRATEFLLKRLDEDAAAAKARADSLQQELRKANDAQTTFMLMQQMQKENDLRKELEDRRRLEMDRLAAPPPPAFIPPMPLMPPMPPEPPRADPGAEMVKAMAEQQARMMEAMLAANKPQPAAQKDTAEWVLPLITQMQQQAMAQAQANQQMLVQIMQGNQQFLQQMMQRESPELSILREELKEVRASAQGPKDSLEDFAEKFQKMQAVSQMLGGGGNGGGFLSDLLANAESIGIGASRIIAAARGTGSGGGALASAPKPQTPAERLDAMPFVEQPALPASQPQAAPKGAQAQPPAQPGQRPVPPADAVAALDAAGDSAAKGEEEAAVHAVVGFLQALTNAPDPYPAFAQRVLSAFRMADDEEDLFVLSKSLWTVVGKKADRDVARALAGVFAKWYGLIHQSVFGEPRELGEREPMTEAEADEQAAVQAAQAAADAEQGDEEEEEEEEEEQPKKASISTATANVAAVTV